MKINELQQYHLEQKDYVWQNKDALRNQGYVKGYRDVYPDIYNRLHASDGIAYIRGNVSIKLMGILYDKVVVHVPPLSKKQLLDRYYLTSWDEFLTLCKHGIVIPIIGKAENYTASHFDALFRELPEKPPSLWARGLGLLDAFGMTDALKIAKGILPIEAIANDKAVYKKYAKKYRKKEEDFIKAKIRDDVAVQYADLCIFGCESEIELLLNMSSKEIYRWLNLLNEVRTYPVLFGLEGQANIDGDKLSAIGTVQIKSEYGLPQSLPENELEILCRGIGVDVDNVTVGEIISYHNDGLGKQLRRALSSFNDYCNSSIQSEQGVAVSEACLRANVFQRQLREAIRELNYGNYYSKLDKGEAVFAKTLKVGTVVAGAAVALCNASSVAVPLVSAGVSLFSIYEEIPESVASILTKFTAEELYSNFVANMWSAKRIVSDSNVKK